MGPAKSIEVVWKAISKILLRENAGWVTVALNFNDI